MRVLIVAQRFHPARTVAAVRWTELAEQLARHGIEVGVACQRRPDDGDDGRVVFAVPRGPKGNEERGRPATRGGSTPRRLRRRARAVARHLALPDPSLLAWLPHRHDLERAARRFAPDVIVTTSPPHSLHLLGRWLSRRLGTPWVIDLRDPYVGDHRFAADVTTPWKLANPAIEGRLVRRAAAVTTAGATHAEDLRRRHRRPGGPIVHLPNGFHPGAAAPPPPGDARPIELAVVSTAGVEALRTVAEAAARLWPRGQVHLRAVGLPDHQVDDLREVVDVEAHPWTPAAELPGLLAPATVLLLVLNPGRGRLGGTSTKLYQYIDVGRPVLAVNPYRADEPLLRRWTRSEVLREPTVAEVEAALRSLVADPGGPPDREEYRASYGWPALGDRLAGLLAEVTRAR